MPFKTIILFSPFLALKHRSICNLPTEEQWVLLDDGLIESEVSSIRSDQSTCMNENELSWVLKIKDKFWVDSYFRDRVWKENKNVGAGNDKASLRNHISAVWARVLLCKMYFATGGQGHVGELKREARVIETRVLKNCPNPEKREFRASSYISFYLASRGILYPNLED